MHPKVPTKNYAHEYAEIAMIAKESSYACSDIGYFYMLDSYFCRGNVVFKKITLHKLQECIYEKDRDD